MKFSRTESCEDCPYYFRNGNSDNTSYCEATAKSVLIPCGLGIPDWCPLDVEDE